MTAGWYPDPTGRFPQRWFDGNTWTNQVVGANGMTTTDAAPATAAAPASASVGAPAAPAAPPIGLATATVGGSGDRSQSWLGLGVAAVGFLVAAASLLVLDWASSVSFSDVRDELPGSLPSGLPFADVVVFHYAKWAGLVILALVVGGLIAVAAAVKGADGDGLRLSVAVIAAAGTVLHAVVVSRMFRGSGPSPEFGAWAGAFGYLIVIGGLAFATPRRNP